MSPAVRNYLNLKRRYRALLEKKSELAIEIKEAERILGDIEYAFTNSELREWRALGVSNQREEQPQ